jgi:hypothetical protein
MFSHEFSCTLERNIYRLSFLAAAVVHAAPRPATASHLKELAHQLGILVVHTLQRIRHAELLGQGKALRGARLERIQDTATTAASLRKDGAKLEGVRAWNFPRVHTLSSRDDLPH